MEKIFDHQKSTATNMELYDSPEFMLEKILNAEYFNLPENKDELHHTVKSRLNKIYASANDRCKHSLGFPANQNFDYTAIAPFLTLHLNNVGDPYAANSPLLNTRAFEQEVLGYFARLWHARSRMPLTPESFWGYVLAMGSTEGNMYALWSAREYFLSKSGSVESGQVTPHHPILFYSQEAHYSIEKSARVVGINTFQDAGNQRYPGQCPVTADGHWPEGVPVDKYGAVNPDSLCELIDFFAAKGHPPILVLTAGTTFQGAFDDVRVVWQKLSNVLERHNFCVETTDAGRPDFWIHIDGALGAAYLPYLEMAYEQGLIKEKGPCFDFRLGCVSSVVMSTHKWFGAPFASGIYMSKEKFRMRPATLPAYIDSPDTTLCGSRNGLSALVLWSAIITVPPYMQAEIAATCMQLATYACEQLETVKTSHPLFHVEKGPQSLVVLFSRPNDDIFNKFQLSGRGEFAHIVVMPHVTPSAIDDLVRTLRNKDAFN